MYTAQQENIKLLTRASSRTYSCFYQNIFLFCNSAMHAHIAGCVTVIRFPTENAIKYKNNVSMLNVFFMQAENTLMISHRCFSVYSDVFCGCLLCTNTGPFPRIGILKGEVTPTNFNHQGRLIDCR